MSMLFEKYRPQTLDQVVGQPKAVATVRRLVDQSQIGGGKFWISGASGTGKTTLARIIARTVADDWCVTEYDSADQVTQHEFDEIGRLTRMYAPGKGGRAWIINEAHGMRGPIVRQMLGLLERLPDHCCMVFTTTKDGEEALFEDQIDASPLLSRCIRIPLTNQGLAEAFADLVMGIARTEGLDGQPREAYLKLARATRNNARDMLCRVQAGVMIGGGS